MTPSPHSTEKHAHTNRLAKEKSPYLLQHAHNPVDWHPWGEEAFDKARAENKMVLVSIGYATCHWCHVMERESFEDEDVADYLNRHYVAIKVDREERPDVDKIYMDALQAMGEQGGWPLNMFTLPDGRPVVGGTYYPPQDMHGRPGFRKVLEMLAQAWQDQRGEMERNAELLTEHLRNQATRAVSETVAWDASPLDAAEAMYAQAFDQDHGGFTLQPQNKFPPSMGLMLLLRQSVRKGNPKTRGMVEHTLQRMAAGGIYDQIGGGLSRYSTDYEWRVPHFEKMLYDNALFVQALTEAYRATGKELYRVYAEDVLNYVLRDLSGPEGAFYSAEDADSEGVEGLFYVWDPEEVEALLDPEDARAALAYWHITPQGNFENSHSIPMALRPLYTVAEELGLKPEDMADRLQRSRETLFQAREKRIRPLRDDKVLTSWNALMISACAKASTAFGEPRLLDAALSAGRFLRENLRDGDGRLLRRYRDGEARFKGYLTDHTSLAVACLDLYEATFDPGWFAEAVRLMEEVNRLFRNEDGPYFDTGSDAEELLARNMEGYDGVEPSGNSQAALAFLRLHAYGRRNGELADATRILGGFKEYLTRAGVSFSAMLSALDFHLGPVREIAIVGDPAAPETQALLQTARAGYHPRTVIALAAPEQVEEAGGLIPLLEGRVPVDGKPAAYVCENMACKLPVTTPEELEKQLG